MYVNTSKMVYCVAEKSTQPKPTVTKLAKHQSEKGVRPSPRQRGSLIAATIT